MLMYVVNYRCINIFAILWFLRLIAQSGHSLDLVHVYMHAQYL
jgi:hypothetical protein